MLDEFEAEVDDPDVLANYYQLDHMATRMRRNSESLLVLANADPKRRRVKATEIDLVVTASTPPSLLRWHHEAERVDGKPGSVVYAKDATAEVAIVPDGSGSMVTYRLMAEPGSLVNTFMLRILAPRPIGRSFETSLARLAVLAEATG